MFLNKSIKLNEGETTFNKMRSYINKKGDRITVSDEHLQTAVELKQLLQKASPSNRCSWAKHRKMMIEEGFDDSENSESYRQMIKSYQSSIGELPNAPKYADMVTTSKLESFKNLVGEVQWEKRENQKYLRQINKGRREIIDGSVFIDEVKAEIRNVLSQVKWEEIMNYTFSPVLDHNDTRMVLCLTDWHIGALVDVDSNQYDYEVAIQRIDNVVDEAMAIAIMRGVYWIDVVFMGDMLEHAYMRNSQAYNAEFPVSEQMTRGGKLLIGVLAKLSRHWHVTYRGFSGNHDRMNGDKNGNIDGDTGMVVVNEMVKMFIEMSEIDSLRYVECQKFSAVIHANGKALKFVHGDLEKKADTGKINDHSSRDGVIYDAIIYGHFHHFGCLEVGIRRFEVRVGSTKGSDDYSEKLGYGSAPSQAVILVSQTGDIEAIRIDCDIIKHREPRDWMEALGL